MADSQAPDTNRRSESNLPERSALQTQSLSRECLRQLGFFAVLEMAERIWRGAHWSRESNRDPTFSARRPVFCRCSRPAGHGHAAAEAYGRSSLTDNLSGGDAARDVHCAAGDRLGLDARRLLHHPGQCRQGKGKEEGIGPANGGLDGDVRFAARMCSRASAGGSCLRKGNGSFGRRMEQSGRQFLPGRHAEYSRTAFARCRSVPFTSDVGGGLREATQRTAKLSLPTQRKNSSFQPRLD